MTPKAKGPGRQYELTESGRSLWPVIEALSNWGATHLELQPEHTDPTFVLWAWVHAHLARDRLPSARTLVEFCFPEQPPVFRRFWILVENGDAHLCDSDPGFEPDVWVEAQSRAFVEWHIGRLRWSRAVAQGQIKVRGSKRIARELPKWNDGRAVA